MSSLLEHAWDLTVPEPDRDVTLAEVQADLVTVSSEDDPVAEQFIRSGGVSYATLVAPAVSGTRPAQTINLQRPASERSVWSRLQSALTDPEATLRAAADARADADADDGNVSDEEPPPPEPASRTDLLVRAVATAALVAVGAVRVLHEPLSQLVPMLQTADPVSRKLAALRRDSPVRALAWHPYLQCFAFALRDDTVHFYDLSFQSLNAVSLLHSHQRDIAAMAWNPQNPTCLAVACRDGICLWSIVCAQGQPSNQAASQPFVVETGWMNYFKHPGRGPVTQLAWSPCGRWLAAASQLDWALVVWDVAREKAHPMIRLGAGITVLSWSPNGHYLVCGTDKSIVRLWETRTWTTEKWVNLGGVCRGVCWSPDSEFLLIGVDTKIHTLRIDLRKPPPRIGAHLVEMNHVTKHTVETASGKEVTLGGTIREMVLDPTGERLAVSFVPDGDGSELIALFAVRREVFLDIRLRGLVRGPPDSGHAELIRFRSQFPRGALLSACWTGGKVSFVPLYFEAGR